MIGTWTTRPAGPVKSPSPYLTFTKTANHLMVIKGAVSNALSRRWLNIRKQIVNTSTLKISTGNMPILKEQKPLAKNTNESGVCECPLKLKAPLTENGHLNEHLVSRHNIINGTSIEDCFAGNAILLLSALKKFPIGQAKPLLTLRGSTKCLRSHVTSTAPI